MSRPSPLAAASTRQRLGLGLAVFGGSGLLLFGLALAWVLGPLGGPDGPFGLEGQRQRLAGTLDAAATVIADAEAAVSRAGASLGETADVAGSAGELMAGLDASLRGAATSLRVDLFGSRPFGAVADDFERVAAQAGAVATDLGVAAESVRAARADLAVLSGNLGALRVEVDAVRAGLAGPIESGGWRLVVAAVLAWFMVPAVVSLVIGLRWLRVPGDRRAVPAPRPPAPR